MRNDHLLNSRPLEMPCVCGKIPLSQIIFWQSALNDIIFKGQEYVDVSPILYNIFLRPRFGDDPYLWFCQIIETFIQLLPKSLTFSFGDIKS